MTTPFDRPARESDSPEFNDGYKFGSEMAEAVAFGGDVVWVHGGHYCLYVMGVRQGFYDTAGIQLCDLAGIAAYEFVVDDCRCQW